MNLVINSELKTVMKRENIYQSRAACIPIIFGSLVLRYIHSIAIRFNKDKLNLHFNELLSSHL